MGFLVNRIVSYCYFLWPILGWALEWEVELFCGWPHCRRHFSETHAAVSAWWPSRLSGRLSGRLSCRWIPSGGWFVAPDQWHVDLFTASTVCEGEFTAGRSFPCPPMGHFAVSIVSVFCVLLFRVANNHVPVEHP